MPLLTFLVEDNRTIRDNLIPALQDLVGAQIVGFADSEQDAADWLARSPASWQLLVVDLFLREGSGLGVLRQVGKRGGHQRVVVLSNYVNASIRDRCLALGADQVFDKSNDLDAFFDYCNALA